MNELYVAIGSQAIEYRGALIERTIGLSHASIPSPTLTLGQRPNLPLGVGGSGLAREQESMAVTPAPSARPTPLAPRLVTSPQLSRLSGLSPNDEWSGELVIDADLSGAVAEYVEMAACELRSVLLTGAELERLRLVDVVARDCEFSGTLARESSMVRAEFQNCRLSGLVISESKLSNVRFVDCKLDDANFRFVTGEQLVFDRCSLISADFYEATFTATEFDACNLTGAQFSKASVGGVRLIGSNVDGVRGVIDMSGVVIAGDQVLPLALSAFNDLGIVIEHEDP